MKGYMSVLLTFIHSKSTLPNGVVFDTEKEATDESIRRGMLIIDDR